MAEFLNIDWDFPELSVIIGQSREFLFLVSPYIDFTPDQLNQLRAASRRGVMITIVFRYFETYEDAKEKTSFIDDTFKLPNIRIVSCQDLHAKIYLNEKNAILTSRNLYERKKGCSIEVGVLFNKYKDAEMYSELHNAAIEISRLDGTDIIVDNITNQKRWKFYKNPWKGYCIRCRAEIYYDPDLPYCLECAREWKYEDGRDKTYPERYCHRCGMRKENISLSHAQEEQCKTQN